jgi:hypothetical protein
MTPQYYYGPRERYKVAPPVFRSVPPGLPKSYGE